MDSKQRMIYLILGTQHPNIKIISKNYLRLAMLEQKVPAIRPIVNLVEVVETRAAIFYGKKEYLRLKNKDGV